MLAAWFSQARASSKVPVVFTKKRFVKKPSGAKPGMVIYEQEKTLFVTPDAEAIAKIAQEG
jgi:predicted ribosome quality control (RQC) complex YloA/Tae2 family protein